MTGVMLEFAEALKGQGFNCPVLMMTSAGGMTSVEAGAPLSHQTARVRPERRCRARGKGRDASEPTEGAVIRYGRNDRESVHHSVGTALSLASSRRARVARLTKGSGFPIRIPAIDIIETGAGGGSIARVEQFRGLVVGPESAGAEPGPASYGRGGTRPTVTDADCVLGYLDPDQFGDGDIKLSRRQRRRCAPERSREPPRSACGGECTGRLRRRGRVDGQCRPGPRG